MTTISLFSARTAATLAAAGIALGATAVAVPTADAAHASVSVSKTQGLNPAGEEITITGRNFSGAFPGIYVGLAQDNKYGPSAQDSFGETTWLQPTQIQGGHFSVKLKVKAVAGKINCKTNSCSIRTLAAHGSPDRSQDTRTPISFKN